MRAADYALGALGVALAVVGFFCVLALGPEPPAPGTRVKPSGLCGYLVLRTGELRLDDRACAPFGGLGQVRYEACQADPACQAREILR